MSFFDGLLVAMEPANLLACFAGALIGTFVGVLPGLGPVATIAMLLPITYHLSPAAAIVMLSGIYYGAPDGGLRGGRPGLGPVATIAMLLPITYHLSPAAAIVMLSGIYYGAQYGGSITAILA